MAKTTEACSPPASTDLDGWRIAAAESGLAAFRLEDIVAAIQDLGPCADPAVIRPLASHLSNALMGILVSYVRPRQTSRGIQIVENTHGYIFEAVLQPDSADGKRPPQIAEEMGLPFTLVLNQFVRALLLAPLRPSVPDVPCVVHELDDSQLRAATWKDGPLPCAALTTRLPAHRWKRPASV